MPDPVYARWQYGQLREIHFAPSRIGTVVTMRTQSAKLTDRQLYELHKLCETWEARQGLHLKQSSPKQTQFRW